MIQFLRKIFPVIVVFTLVFNLTSLSFAQSDRELIDNQPSYDLITSLEDGSPHPNKPVTRAEAVDFLVNALGYLNKENRETLEIDLPYHDSNQIPVWNQASIQVALNHNLIPVSPSNFQPEKKATRLEVVNMIAKVLNEENTLYRNLSLHFTDLTPLSTNDLLNIKLVLSKGIVSGFKDNTFRPNKPVTRAEMAEFMNRLIDQVQSPVPIETISAMFVEIINDLIFVKPTTTTNTSQITSYKLSNEVEVFKLFPNSSKVTINLNDIQANDKIELVFNQNKEVTTITVLSPEQVVELQGDVRYVDPVTKQIRIRRLDNNNFIYNTYSVASNALIIEGSLNILISLKDIQVGDKVLFKVNADNLIYQLHVITDIVSNTD